MKTNLKQVSTVALAILAGHSIAAHAESYQLGVDSLSVQGSAMRGSRGESAKLGGVQLQENDLIAKPKDQAINIAESEMLLTGSAGVAKADKSATSSQYAQGVSLTGKRDWGKQFGSEVCGTYWSGGVNYEVSILNSSEKFISNSGQAHVRTGVGLLCSDGKSFATLVQPIVGAGADMNTGGTFDVGGRAKFILGNKVALTAEMVKKLGMKELAADGDAKNAGYDASVGVQLVVHKDFVIGLDARRSDRLDREPAADGSTRTRIEQVGLSAGAAF